MEVVELWILLANVPHPDRNKCLTMLCSQDCRLLLPQSPLTKRALAAAMLVFLRYCLRLTPLLTYDPFLHPMLR